ncbi:MAG: elongation factor Tu, partial [Myxococcales bacterium]|nr:elongation factor Tu [Myxococcales bacterium]
FIRGSALRALHGGEAEGACIVELLAAMDEHFKVPVRDEAGPFMMPIEGVCTIPGRGTVITGRVDRGTLVRGDQVEIVGLRGGTGAPVVVTGIQAFHRDIPAARAGLNVGMLLRGVGRDEVQRGQVAVLPGSIHPHRAGRAEIFTLTAKEGGRHTPFGTGYQPHFYFGAADVTATIDVGERGSVNPGDRVEIRFKLGHPVACEPGMRFAIREGGKTIGAGVVLEVQP